MELAGIAHVRDRLIKNLSKGYRQRVGLAQALVGNPRVLILDEPTIGLDPHQIIEIRSLIRELGHEHTIILSSHILPEVSAVCNRVIIINRGKLVASDTTANLGRRLHDSSQFRLRVAGGEAAALAALRGVPGVQEVSAQGSVEQGTVDLRVATAAGADPRRAIFGALSKADLPIYLMTAMDYTLEEIFLQLTTTDAAAGAAESAAAEPPPAGSAPPPAARRRGGRGGRLMLAVLLRELRAYYLSPIGYIFMGFFLLLAGFFFATDNVLRSNPQFQGVLRLHHLRVPGHRADFSPCACSPTRSASAPTSS